MADRSRRLSRSLLALLVDRGAKQVGNVAQRGHARPGLLVIAYVFGIVFLSDCSRRKTDLLLSRIQLEDLELKHLTDHNRILRLLDSRIAQLGDVAKTFDPFLDLYKRAKVREPHNLARDHIAQAVRLKESIPRVWLQILY